MSRFTWTMLAGGCLAVAAGGVAAGLLVLGHPAARWVGAGVVLLAGVVVFLLFLAASVCARARIRRASPDAREVRNSAAEVSGHSVQAGAVHGDVSVDDHGTTVDQRGSTAGRDIIGQQTNHAHPGDP